MAETPGQQYPALNEQGETLQQAAGVKSTTYGRFGSKGFAFDAPAAATTKFSFKYPFKVDLLEGALYLTGSEAGDVARFTVAPDVPLNAVVGGQNVLAAPIVASDKQMALVPALLTVFVDQALIDAGLWEIMVTDGVNTNGPYLVTGYNKTTGMVTLGIVQSWIGAAPAAWAGFVNGFAVNATVKVTRVMVDSVELDSAAQVIHMGQSARSAGPIPAGTEMRFEYTNSGIAARRVRFVPDFLSGVPLSAGG